MRAREQKGQHVDDNSPGAVFASPELAIERGSDFGERVSDILGTLVELITDPTDETHKAGPPNGPLGDLVDDLSSAAHWVAATDDADYGCTTDAAMSNPDLVKHVLALRKPKNLSKVDMDDPVIYHRHPSGPTDRDIWVLTLGGLEAYGLIADPKRQGDPSYAWSLHAWLCESLWLTPGEQRDVRDIAQTLECAVVDRFDPRKAKKPTTITKSADAERGTDMSEPTNPMEAVKAFMGAVQSGDRTAALDHIAVGERLFPSAAIPRAGDWAGLRKLLDQKLPAPAVAEEAPVRVSAEVAGELADAAALEEKLEAAAAGGVEDDQDDDADGEAAAPEETAAPELVLPSLAISHTVDNGTVLLGTGGGPVGKAVSAVMGKDGQKWRYHFRDRAWYVPRTMGAVADRERIDAARTALLDAGFPAVDVEIDNVDPMTGELAPETPPVVEKPRKQRAETRTAVAEPAGRPKAAPVVAVPDQDKAALLALAEQLAELLAPHGIEIGVPVVVPAKRASAKRASAKAKAAPVAVVEPPATGPITVVLGLEDDAHPKHTASALRRTLYSEVTSKVGGGAGLDLHVYRQGRSLTITANPPATGSRRGRDELTAKLIAAAAVVRGVVAAAA
jgi:limonene-1,2-epoxide hydrolase